MGVGNPGAFHFLFDRKLDKSSTTFDIRHRLVSSVVYEIPYKKTQEGVLGKILGGWQTNFIFTAQTGNATQVGDGANGPDSWSRFDRPDLVADPNLPRGDKTESRYFNVDAFQSVREPRYGTAPRMMVTQPGLWNTDFTLLKRFKFTESMGFEIRGDFYNSSTMQTGAPSTRRFETLQSLDRPAHSPTLMAG